MPLRRLRSASRKVPFASHSPLGAAASRIPQPGATSKPCAHPPTPGAGRAAGHLPAAPGDAPSPPARAVATGGEQSRGEGLPAALPALPAANTDHPPGMGGGHRFQRRGALGERRCSGGKAWGWGFLDLSVCIPGGGGDIITHPPTPPPPKKGPCPSLAEGRLVRRWPSKPRRVPRGARGPQHTFPPPQGLCRTSPLRTGQVGFGGRSVTAHCHPDWGGLSRPRGGVLGVGGGLSKKGGLVGGQKPGGVGGVGLGGASLPAAATGARGAHRAVGELGAEVGGWGLPPRRPRPRSPSPPRAVCAALLRSDVTPAEEPGRRAQPSRMPRPGIPFPLNCGLTARGGSYPVSPGGPEHRAMGIPPLRAAPGPAAAGGSATSPPRSLPRSPFARQTFQERQGSSVSKGTTRESSCC